MKTKSQRGIILLELLVVLAVFVVLTGLIGINFQELIQAKNESNAQAGVTALSKAESTYNSTFNGYVSGANLHYLSDCPAPTVVNGKTVVVATKTAACIPISQAYTNLASAYHYNFNVTPTVGPDGIAGTADDGVLVTATPVNAGSGRVTYCTENFDGLLRGQPKGATPTTAAACDAFNVIASGPTSQPTPPSNLPVTGMSSSGQVNLYTLGSPPSTTGVGPVTVATVSIPTQGKYLVQAHIVGVARTGSTIPCSISDGGTTVVSGSILSVANSSLTWPESLNLIAYDSPQAATTLTLACTGNGSASSQTNPMPNVVLAATLDAVQSQ